MPRWSDHLSLRGKGFFEVIHNIKVRDATSQFKNESLLSTIVGMQAPSVELAVAFASASPFLSNPSSLATADPALHRLQYNKPAGELSDVLVFTVPDGAQRNEVVQVLKRVESVLRVDVLEPRMRRKRDEF